MEKKCIKSCLTFIWDQSNDQHLSITIPYSLLLARWDVLLLICCYIEQYIPYIINISILQFLSFSEFYIYFFVFIFLGSFSFGSTSGSLSKIILQFNLNISSFLGYFKCLLLVWFFSQYVILTVPPKNQMQIFSILLLFLFSSFCLTKSILKSITEKLKILNVIIMNSS